MSEAATIAECFPPTFTSKLGSHYKINFRGQKQNNGGFYGEIQRKLAIVSETKSNNKEKAAI